MKLLGSFDGSIATQKLARCCGDRLEYLTQSERYQLLLSLATCMHVYAELEDGDEIESPAEVCEGLASVVVSYNVTACLLIYHTESPETIAAILPAIAFFAESERSETPPEQERVEGDLIISGLYLILQDHGYI